MASELTAEYRHWLPHGTGAQPCAPTAAWHYAPIAYQCPYGRTAVRPNHR
ncbi:MAG: hypothetical protein IT211_09185 [Armatimonadetes bacterium]|nr:hypothetical protein [Armatimonadota bacterium]